MDSSCTSDGDPKRNQASEYWGFTKVALHRTSKGETDLGGREDGQMMTEEMAEAKS